MTREQIENMPAGREMDNLVMDYLGITVDDNFYTLKYSTDIKAAGQIVAEFPEVYIEKSKGKFFCMIGDNFDNSAEADTAPLAICRAYLLYKMDSEL
jgi:hypothetical protein